MSLPNDVDEKELLAAFELRYARNLEWIHGKTKRSLAEDFLTSWQLSPAEARFDFGPQSLVFTGDPEARPVIHAEVGLEASRLILTGGSPTDGVHIFNGFIDHVARRLLHLALKRVGLRIQRIFPMDAQRAADYLSGALPDVARIAQPGDTPWTILTLRRSGQVDPWKLTEVIQATQQVTVNLFITPGNPPQGTATPGESGLIWDLDVYRDGEQGVSFQPNEIDVADMKRISEDILTQWRRVLYG